MRIRNAFRLRYRSPHGRLAGYSVLMAVFGVLCSAGCNHSVTTSAVQQFAPHSTGNPPGYFDVPLPVVERDHHIVAVGKYVLPEPIVLPKTVSAQHMATALVWSGEGRHALIDVMIYFPEHDAKAILAWGRTYPIPVRHIGAAFWDSKQPKYLEHRLPPETGYEWIDQPPAVDAYKTTWQVGGIFFTKSWQYILTFCHGGWIENGVTYPWRKKKGNLYLDFSFGKRPSFVWLPLYEQGQSIVAVGRYHLPTPLVVPHGITPLPEALAVLSPSSLSFQNIRIFFDPKEEAAVFQWAKSWDITGKPGGAHVRPADHSFWTSDANDPHGVRSYYMPVPSAPPLAWVIDGTLPSLNRRYRLTFNGMKVVTNKDPSSNLTAQYFLPSSLADYVGGSDDFGTNSPLKGEHRHVFLRLTRTNL